MTIRTISGTGPLFSSSFRSEYGLLIVLGFRASLVAGRQAQSVSPSPRRHSQTTGSQAASSRKKPIHTTPLVGNCSTLAPQIRIAVSALLELARSCQARQEAFQGGDQCQASHDDRFPP